MGALCRVSLAEERLTAGAAALLLAAPPEKMRLEKANLLLGQEIAELIVPPVLRHKHLDGDGRTMLASCSDGLRRIGGLGSYAGMERGHRHASSRV
jgi:hypothetical protein